MAMPSRTAVRLTPSFAASFVAGSWSLLAGVSSGAKTIALTVAISLAAALLFPVKDGEEAQA